MHKDYIKLLIGKSIHQSQEWKVFQQSINREVFEIEGIKIVKIRLPLNLCWFWVARVNLTNKNKFFDEIKKLAKEQKAIYIRFENSVLSSQFPACTNSGRSVLSSQFSALSSQLSVLSSQFSYLPQHTLIIDLEQSLAEILTQMKQKGRYNIKIAEKNNIEIEKYDFTNKNLEKMINVFFQILTETTNRDGFEAHNEDYYFKMLKNLKEKVCLYLAKYNGEYIGGTIHTFSENTCTYYYGASSGKYRNLMAPYLLQWQAVCDAKEKGYKIYDFLGISKLNKEGDYDKNDKLAKVTEFKMKFGGIAINYEATKVYIFKPFCYCLMRIYKKLTFLSFLLLLRL